MITIAKTNSKFSQSHCRAIIVGRIADISGWARHEVEKMLRSVSLPLSDYVAIENDAQTREVMARYLLYCDLAKSPINE